MIHKYISDMYNRGQDEQARRAIAAEIIRDATPEDEEPIYEPTEAEIDSSEAEYYAARRAYKYGPPEEQMHFIAEHGLEAWQAKVAEIKTEVPKPEVMNA